MWDRDKEFLRLYLMGKDAESIAFVLKDSCMPNVRRRLDYLIRDIHKSDNPAERLIQLGIIPEYRISEKGRKLLPDKE